MVLGYLSGLKKSGYLSGFRLSSLKLSSLRLSKWSKAIYSWAM